MRYILLTFLVVFACGKQKVEVEDSEHDVNIKAGICDVFEDKEEKQECVRKVVSALEECNK